MLEYFYQALTEPLGICVSVSGDRTLARAKLYAARKAACDPSLDGISIVFSPTDETQLWLVKNGKANASS